MRDSAGTTTIPAPEAAPPEEPPEPPVLEEVTFLASDGVILAADLRRGSPEWYLFAHQNGRNRGVWGDLPQTASEQSGFSTLAWDFRGVGASDAGERGDIVLDWLAAIARGLAGRDDDSTRSAPAWSSPRERFGLQPGADLGAGELLRH